MSVPKNHSAYLPEAFDPKLPVALVAGQGIYPQLAARAMRAAGVPVRLIAFEGETAPELVSSFPEAERHSVHVGQVGKTLGCSRSSGRVTP